MPRRPTGRPPGRPRHPGLLTPAEQRVLAEVRLGLTNAEIGVRLGLSPDTVKTHVASMLSKLGLGDRRELADWRDSDGRRWGWWRLGWVPAGLAVLGGVATIGFVVAGIAVVMRVRDDLPAPSPSPEATSSSLATLNVTSTLDSVVQRRTKPVRVSALDFLTADTGWMALDGQRLFRSDDGGTTWMELPPLDGTISALSFESDAEGWAAVGGQIRRTADGGQSWIGVPAEHEVTWLQSAGGTLFVDGVDGPFAIDADGTWRSMEAPCAWHGSTGWRRALSFTDRVSGWAVCSNSGVKPSATKWLMRTTDGGRSWTWWASGSDPPAGDPLPETDREFPASFQGEAFAMSTDGAIVAGCGGAVVTDDGAESWQDALFAGGGCTTGSYVAVDAVPGGTFFAAHEPGPALMRRDPDGKWRQAYPPPGAGPVARWVTTSVGYGLAGTAETPQPLIIAGGDRPQEVVTTRDGGRTWLALPAPLGEPAGVALNGKGNGLAFRADGATYFTVDGGASWQHIEGVVAAAVSVDPAGGMWVVTTSGNLLHSSDSWATHQGVAGGVGTAWIDFASEQEGWALSEDGVLSQSLDGGWTWRPLAVDVQSATFTPGGIGWVLTRESGRLLKTQDRGLRWTEVLVKGVRRESIAAVDADHAWLYGPNGCWLVTTDGGRTWRWPGPEGWAPCGA